MKVTPVPINIEPVRSSASFNTIHAPSFTFCGACC